MKCILVGNILGSSVIFSNAGAMFNQLTWSLTKYKLFSSFMIYLEFSLCLSPSIDKLGNLSLIIQHNALKIIQFHIWSWER